MPDAAGGQPEAGINDQGSLILGAAPPGTACLECEPRPRSEHSERTVGGTQRGIFAEFYAGHAAAACKLGLRLVEAK